MTVLPRRGYRSTTNPRIRLEPNMSDTPTIDVAAVRAALAEHQRDNSWSDMFETLCLCGDRFANQAEFVDHQTEAAIAAAIR